MHFSKLSVSAACLAVSFLEVTSAIPLNHAARSAPITVTSLPFSFTAAFTANLTLGAPSRPVTVPGGVLINEPITGGTIHGTAINGTIESGFAHPILYDNGTLQDAIIDAYGTTDDGQAFYIHEEGYGTNAAQVTRIEVMVGGTKYRQLNEGFVLASVNPNANRTMVMVQAYLVGNTLA